MRHERKNAGKTYKGHDSSREGKYMTESAKITFYPLRIEGEVPKGITILEAARKCGISVESPCGGTGKCGRDIVQIRINKTLDMVLACKTVVETDMEVALPSQEKDDMKIIDGFFTKDSRQYNMNPSVKKEPVHYGNGLYSTRVYANDKLIATEEGDTQSCMYGIALDIGTTTLVASLVDLHNGNILENSSVLNPLVYYGHDVISRIKHSLSHKDGLFRMHVELISAVNFLITCLLSLRGIKHENIYQVIAAGNTTMQHIFLNKEIKGIGEYPYTAETLDTFTTTAKELAIAIAEYAPVTTFPCFSAYVGGDIVSGLLAIHYDETLELPSIFLDIGTNGEMVLFLGNQIVATSTAAGPCFEGVSISSGMRASMGAIEHVRFAENLSFDVIGGGKPSGICGSGLVETVSELVRVGLVNSMGRLQNKASGNLPTKYQKYLFDKNGKRHFRLTDDVSISQEDIRQVQLAKAAIRSGIEILLTAHNLKPEDLKTVIIAGAFGHHLSKESLFGIGILPALKHAKFSFVGNSSLEGAVQALLNKKLVNDASQIARAVQVMELSQFPTFEDIFVKEMHF
jgi:uncharacterized 2Fe-2S/4Fe-4S cluster protein (DUF4445 family)